MNNKEIYDHVYNNPNTYPDYGNSNHGQPHASYVESLLEPGDSILDVGCGNNQFLKGLATNHLSQAIGIDVSAPGADIIVDFIIFANRCKDNEFDIIVSFDFLEHIDKELITTYLNEMARIAKKFVFTIGVGQSVYNVKGVNLHKTRKTNMEWLTLLQNIYSSDAKFIDGRFQGTFDEPEQQTNLK